MWKFLEKWFGPRKIDEVKEKVLTPEVINKIGDNISKANPVFEIKEKPVVKVENRILYNLETEKAVREGDSVIDKTGNSRTIIGLTKSKLGIKVVCLDNSELHLFNFPNLKAVEVNDSDI